MLEQFLLYGLLIAVIFMLQVRKVATSIKLLVLQSIILTIFSITIALKTNTSALFITAGLTLVIKAIAIPAILHYTIVKIDINRYTEPYMNRQYSLAIALGLLIVSYYVTGQMNLPGNESLNEFLPVSVSLIFLGSFIMIVHKKAIMQGVGLITIENGLFLLTVSIFTGMPLVVELGIFFELLIMVIIIGILSFRIHSAFDSISTDKLKKLKG